jgi:glycosyltransferase involved in cell wall biosynthesis
MKIAVNTRLLLANKLGGIGWFAYHTLKRIVKNNPQHQFIFLFDRKYSEEFIFGSNVIPEVIFPPTRHPILSYIWLEYSIVNTIRRHKPDLFYSPDGYLSLKIKDIPSIAAIHDLNFHHNPKDVPYVVSKYYDYFFPRFAKLANRIITVSEFSRQDISKQYNIPLSKIDVAYNGANEIFEPINEEDKNKVKEEYTSGCDYFIHIGILVPRKNVALLLKAFSEYKQATGRKTKLVIVGEKMFLTKDIEEAFSNSSFKSDIIFTGRLAPDKLKYLLGAAKSLLLVSYFEGFGIPIIEAMYADVPVITSNITSMPEIAGDAAILVDPFSVDSIKNALIRMENDHQLRQQLIEKARERRRLFTWDKSAEVIWKSFEKALAGDIT